jgi:ATP-dependent Lon protease
MSQLEAALKLCSFVSLTELHIDHTWFSNEHDIHIHVPDGATPKDGPSAGITLATALLQRNTANHPVKQDVAMTGEITLRGRVLPIGGLKEKMLAGKQAGVKTVIFPKKNEKDLKKIPTEIKGGLDLHAVAEAEDVLKLALELTNPEEFMKVVSGAALKVVDTDSDSQVAN